MLPRHPHRGFETVTYMLDGAFEHKDSTGGGGLLTDGTTQWMTAAVRILHSELPPQEFVAKGGLFHGVQLWVNLPKALKWTPPRYQDIDAGDVRLISSADGGALIRLIAGSRRRRSRRDVHAHHVLAHDHRPWCHVGPALAGRLQRPCVRAVGPRPRRTAWAAAGGGPAAMFGTGDADHARGRRSAAACCRLPTSRAGGY